MIEQVQRLASRPARRLARMAAVGVGLGALFGGITVLAAASPSGAAGNLYVSSYGTDTGNCTNAGAPCLTLKYAYQHASAGNTINLDGDTFPVNDLVIAKDVTIVGSAAGGSLNVTTSTISAEGHSFALTISAPDVTLTNLIVNDASVGAVYSNPGAGLTLNNVIIGSDSDVTDNEAGIVNYGDLFVNGGAISGNSSLAGSGLINDPGGLAIVTNVAFNHDAAYGPFGEAGAIANDRGTLELKGTTAIHNNSASVDGGGIEECPQAGTTISIGPKVSITGNTPNNISSADPAGDCH
jgi:hypothetical protein